MNHAASIYPVVHLSTYRYILFVQVYTLIHLVFKDLGLIFSHFTPVATRRRECATRNRITPATCKYQHIITTDEQRQKQRQQRVRPHNTNPSVSLPPSHTHIQRNAWTWGLYCQSRTDATIVDILTTACFVQRCKYDQILCSDFTLDVDVHCVCVVCHCVFCMRACDTVCRRPGPRESHSQWRCGRCLQAISQPSQLSIRAGNVNFESLSKISSAFPTRTRVIWWATESTNPRPDLTCLTTYPYTPPERDTHPILILASARTWSKLPDESKLVNIPVQ